MALEDFDTPLTPNQQIATDAFRRIDAVYGEELAKIIDNSEASQYLAMLMENINVTNRVFTC